KLAESGLEAMRAAGLEVDEQLDLSPAELLVAVRGAAGLVIRSAPQVTAAVLEAADSLVVVGRAGIGLDNVDVDAATRRGVMVGNAPQSNVISAAEHTMALLLAQAALKEGRWGGSRWEGVELNDKVLGIVGLGRVGKLVAQRAHAFAMRVLAYDPFVSPDRGRQMSVDLVPLAKLMAESDFVTIHLPKTAETVGLLDGDMLGLEKGGGRIVNTARGGIIEEEAAPAGL